MNKAIEQHDQTTPQRDWSDFDYTNVDEQTAQALRQAGDEWHDAGRKIFEQIVRRGMIAENVFNRHNGLFTKWCEQIARASVQTVNNYRAVARHLADLDPDVAAQFQARALYVLARDIMTDEQRAAALEWVQDQSDTDETITRELATIALPSTPQYIKDAYKARSMTQMQAYTLAIALGRMRELSFDYWSIMVDNQVQHSGVVDYIRGVIQRASDGDRARLDDLSHNQWRFCFLESNREYEIPLNQATAETVERYIAYHRWVHLQVALRQQAEIERQQAENELKAYYKGATVSKVNATPNGLVSMSFQLPPDIVEGASLNDIELIVNYKIKKRGDA